MNISYIKGCNDPSLDLNSYLCNLKNYAISVPRNGRNIHSKLSTARHRAMSSSNQPTLQLQVWKRVPSNRHLPSDDRDLLPPFMTILATLSLHSIRAECNDFKTNL